jgi:hypothetical protein
MRFLRRVVSAATGPPSGGASSGRGSAANRHSSCLTSLGTFPAASFSRRTGSMRSRTSSSRTASTSPTSGLRTASRRQPPRSTSDRGRSTIGLTPGERNDMYALLQMYFCGTDRARFEADLREKQIVILLRDASSGRIQGISTLMRMTTSIDEKEVVAFFSGDTIVDREYWGETVLSRIWSQTVLHSSMPAHPVRRATGFFLLSSGSSVVGSSFLRYAPSHRLPPICVAGRRSTQPRPPPIVLRLSI